MGTSKRWIVGMLSDQITGNYEAWLIDGRSFDDYEEACDYSAELEGFRGDGESVYFEEKEEEDEPEWKPSMKFGPLFGVGIRKRTPNRPGYI